MIETLLYWLRLPIPWYIRVGWLGCCLLLAPLLAPKPSAIWSLDRYSYQIQEAPAGTILVNFGDHLARYDRTTHTLINQFPAIGDNMSPSLDGQWIAKANSSSLATVTIYRAVDGVVAAHIPVPQTISIAQMVWSPDNQFILRAADMTHLDQPIIRTWSAQPPTLSLPNWNPLPDYLAFSADGHYLAWSQADMLTLWDTTTQTIRYQHRYGLQETGIFAEPRFPPKQNRYDPGQFFIGAIIFTPDTNQMIIVRHDTILAIRRQDGAPLWKMTTGDPDPTLPTTLVRDGPIDFGELQISHDGQSATLSLGSTEISYFGLLLFPTKIPAFYWIDLHSGTIRRTYQSDSPSGSILFAADDQSVLVGQDRAIATWPLAFPSIWPSVPWLLAALAVVHGLFQWLDRWWLRRQERTRP